MAPIYGNLAENVRQSPGICVNINPAPKYAMFSLLDAYAGMMVIFAYLFLRSQGSQESPQPARWADGCTEFQQPSDTLEGTISC